MSHLEKIALERWNTTEMQDEKCQRLSKVFNSFFEKVNCKRQ